MKVYMLRKALNGTSSQSFEQKDKWFSDRDRFHKMYFRVWYVCQRLNQAQLDYHMLICTWDGDHNFKWRWDLEIQGKHDVRIWNVLLRKLILFPRNGVQRYKKMSVLVPKEEYIGYFKKIQNEKFQLNNNTIGDKIKVEQGYKDELVNATLYTQIIGSFRYLCNIGPNICQNVSLINRCLPLFLVNQTIIFSSLTGLNSKKS